MMRTFWTVLAASFLLLGAYVTRADHPAATDGNKPTLVINLTSGSDDLHAVVMGLHFAEHGLADGREVVVFFNVKAPPLARKGLDDSVRFKEMPPVRDMVSGLLKQGAKMVVCPMCAEITGVEASELAPGIEMIKDRKQIFDHLHADSVVFTY